MSAILRLHYKIRNLFLKEQIKYPSLGGSAATVAISIIVFNIKIGRFPRSLCSLGMTVLFDKDCKKFLIFQLKFVILRPISKQKYLCTYPL